MNENSATGPVRINFTALNADGQAPYALAEFDRVLQYRGSDFVCYANEGYERQQEADTDMLSRILDKLVGRKPENEAEEPHVIPDSGVGQVQVKVFKLIMTRSKAVPPEEIYQLIRDALAEGGHEFVEVDTDGKVKDLRRKPFWVRVIESTRHKSPLIRLHYRR